MLKQAFAAAMLVASTVSAAQAQTIYPINRAEILATSNFDFKVEFPDAPQALNGVTVTINGVDARQVLGNEVAFIPNEDGQNYSAYWIRKSQLNKPGRYIVEARSGNRVAQVTWEVYGTAEKALNAFSVCEQALKVQVPNTLHRI
jgi:alkaline phosphatase